MDRRITVGADSRRGRETNYCSKSGLTRCSSTVSAQKRMTRSRSPARYFRTPTYSTKTFTLSRCRQRTVTLANHVFNRTSGVRYLRRQIVTPHHVPLLSNLVELMIDKRPRSLVSRTVLKDLCFGETESPMLFAMQEQPQSQIGPGCCQGISTRQRELARFRVIERKKAAAPTKTNPPLTCNWNSWLRPASIR